MSESGADPAAPRPRVAALGRQGLFIAEPADHVISPVIRRYCKYQIHPPDPATWISSADCALLHLRKRGLVLTQPYQLGSIQPAPCRKLVVLTTVSR